ncbi:hypothetical protein AK812_SmicGene47871, partial [Symbiodinium microadriaticum]
ESAADVRPVCRGGPCGSCVLGTMTSHSQELNNACHNVCYSIAK